MAAILGQLQARGDPGAISDIAVDVTGALGVDGLTVSLATGSDLTVTELLWCTDTTAREFEDLQLTLGEGPGPEAVRTGAMVWVPDLTLISTARWPALAVEAPALTARAVFCFPLAIGAIKVGVLSAVRRTPGPLTPAQADDALVLASALTARFLNSDEPPSGGLDQPDPLCDLQHAVVHQATGMLSAQLSLPLPQALLRLRAHAYSSGRSIIDTSKDVVGRRLRLDHRGNGEGPTTPVADKD
ncbi:GAF and ANTAR domain-containing protein [Kitasatospora sp. NPDC057223]|uniref:GAF and ANTAR domain-containing protein n=1 Tax=Kitasatospora sp. NPDC057223 TaxID=3346055 RepID=UPI00364363EA